MPVRDSQFRMIKRRLLISDTFIRQRLQEGDQSIDLPIIPLDFLNSINIRRGVWNVRTTKVSSSSVELNNFFQRSSATIMEIGARQLAIPQTWRLK